MNYRRLAGSRLYRAIARAAPSCTLWVHDVRWAGYRFRFRPRWFIPDIHVVE